ncbi:MAG: ATP phosphoribosyltransferase regulatory subunit [Helicobacteraceae bacterium]|jgi:histidyl-tRNA synthetase|nr:ATP phosphoribosyltransferase regulatory subunit [Helicobacteraceae bacterium]
MIGEYEIPSGSKLYFGESARKKRDLESLAVRIFAEFNYEEICTPVFSYHQNADGEAIRLADQNNNTVFLRRDSSIEAVRLILKRLGFATEHRKWFYIQPVFRFPTEEIHQIGAESIGESDLAQVAGVCAKILAGFSGMTLQIGSIALLRAIENELEIDREILIRHEIHKLFEIAENKRLNWLKSLIKISDLNDAEEAIKIAPYGVVKPLKNLRDLAQKCAAFNTARIALSPLFYANMPYYDDLYFRFLLGGKQIALGGSYDSGEQRASGFAIYQDLLI